MDPRLHADITRRLDRDYQFKEQSGWLRQGICPDCKKKSVYTHAEHPWVLRCERLAKCGAEWHVKELYPELFEKWSERHPTTPANPNAAADAYLESARGFDLEKLRGCYVQESYYDHALKIGSATVRFQVADGYWERIIDEPGRFGDKKAHFKKGTHYGGTWWQPPWLAYAGLKELWIVEGIFDAIAMGHHALQAVSAMSCNNYPEASLQALAEQCAANKVERPTLVWALDGDAAGRKFTRQWVRKAREQGWKCEAAVIPQHGKAKLDWNDMHQRERLEAEHLEDYRHEGALLIAESAGAKAVLMYQKGGGSSFPFEFGSRLYWFKLDLEKYHKAAEAIEESDPKLEKKEVRERALLEAHAVTEIATCYPQALYFQQNTLTDESWYYLRVSFPTDTAAVKNTFTSAQLSAAAEFKKRLLGMAQGAIYTGTTGMLDALWKHQLKHIARVETIDFIGYSKEHAAYVFGDMAVAKGRQVAINTEDYFELGRLSIKSLNQSVGLAINHDLKEFKTAWLGQLWKAFGAKGVVALAFWFGALYAEQIRHRHKSYPFVEIVGEPGAGKTTLIEFLWKLCGRRDYEGFDPSKSTLAARARNFAQVANLPVVLIEGDRQEDSAKKGGFDWDELKTAYNGRSTRARGMKNGGNETYEPPFRGAVVISQNAEVSASEAILSRIVHLYFDRSAQTPETRAAAELLERAELEAVSGLILKAAMAEEKVLSRFEDLAPGMELVLAGKPEIRNVRVIKNHAQVMALVSCLAEVLPMADHHIDAAHDELIAMAKARQQALSADHPFVAEFWEIYEFLEDDAGGDEEAPTVLNHSRDPKVIAISLPHFEQVCTDRKLRIPPVIDLKRVLRTSRAHKFIDVRTVNSRIHERLNRNAAMNGSSAPQKPTSVKCWCFAA